MKLFFNDERMFLLSLYIIYMSNVVFIIGINRKASDTRLGVKFFLAQNAVRRSSEIRYNIIAVKIIIISFLLLSVFEMNFIFAVHNTSSLSIPLNASRSWSL